MPLKELLALEAKIEAAIGEKRVSERHEVKAKMEELARASGFSVGELFGGKGKGKGIAKYRNPDPSRDLDRTRAQADRLIEAGGNPERFLIS